MAAAEGPSALMPPPDTDAADARAVTDPGIGALPSLCPYLATPDGSWRSARAVREHRCLAVSPPVPLAAEKQRRLCLVDAHTGCATYGAAMAARAEPPERASGHARPIARMTPVILDHGRFDVRVPAWRTDRTSQGVLVGLLGVAFTAILLARPAVPAGAGPLVDPSSSPAGGAAPTASVAVEPTDPTVPPVSSDEPAATPPTSGDPGAQASSGAEPSAEPTTSGATYRVKSGDTLSAIAARFGTTTQVLARLNDIADPSKLKIGQILKLP
jgi:LysM repeat protein